MTWADITLSNTTTRNSSRFLRAKPFYDSTKSGVDFQLIFSETDPWYFSSGDPVTLSDVTRNDPTG